MVSAVNRPVSPLLCAPFAVARRARKVYARRGILFAVVAQDRDRQSILCAFFSRRRAAGAAMGRGRGRGHSRALNVVDGNVGDI